MNFTKSSSRVDTIDELLYFSYEHLDICWMKANVKRSEKFIRSIILMSKHNFQLFVASYSEYNGFCMKKFPIFIANECICQQMHFMWLF